jgi:hypothetical protein
VPDWQLYSGFFQEPTVICDGEQAPPNGTGGSSPRGLAVPRDEQLKALLVGLHDGGVPEESTSGMTGQRSASS